MKALRRIVLIILLSSFQYYSQGTMLVESDKSNYSYGEMIKVKVSILNNSDTSFTIWGSSSCIVMLGMNSIQFQTSCTADNSPFEFAPHSSRTWFWDLDPKILGVPDKDGEQTIYGIGGGHYDSLKIAAPKYYGGILAVGIDTSASSQIQSLRDSLGVVVLRSDTLTPVGSISETWEISNYSIDSLINIYSSDSRIKYIEAQRPLQFKDEVYTSVSTELEKPLIFNLEQNYPNPFNPTTKIRYSVPKSSFVKLTVYNLLGKIITELVNEYKLKGSYQIEFNGSNLSSGVYFYTLSSGSYVQTKKLILLR